MAIPVDEKNRLALARVKSISTPVGTYGSEKANPLAPTRFAVDK